MESQNANMGKLITKIPKRYKVIILFIILLVFVALTVFAQADTKLEKQAPLTLNYIILQIVQLLIGVGGLAVTIIAAIKVMFGNKLKPECKEMFAAIKLQFEKMAQVKPVCAQNFVDMKEDLTKYKSEMQTYLFNVSALQASFGKLEARFDDFKDRFDRLENKIDNIK